MEKTLEQMAQSKRLQKIAFCAECGIKYSLKKREKETRDMPIPNTAVKYHNNSCWIIGTAAIDYS